MIFEESQTGFNHHTKNRKTQNPEMISGVFRTTSIVHHGHPRFKLDVPKEGSFPIPLKNIEVVRRTNKTLDVLLDSRTDDNWNVNGVRELSGPCTSFTHFTIFYEKLPNGVHVVRGRLTKIPATSSPNYLWPEVWSTMPKSFQQKEKTAPGYRKAEARQCS